jgi:hypothetical protein
MSVEIQWNDTDPETGEKRFVRVERFAGKWEFAVRLKRREPWTTPALITRDMWETLYEALQRRYTRREGVSDADLATVKRILAQHREPPAAEPE